MEIYINRFNGAVTFSLRKCICIAILMSRVTALQWGRNFFVTEIGTTIVFVSVIDQLQWGRNFFVTEITKLLRWYTVNRR